MRRSLSAVRAWQGGRVLAWVTVASLVVAAVSLAHDVLTEDEPGAFSVLELSADSTKDVPATEKAEAGSAATTHTTIEATILSVGLKNDTTSLRTFKEIGVRNKGQVSITACEGGSGGGTVFTADYAIDIPDVGHTARVAVPHGHNFEPKKAEAFHLTLGTGNATGRDDKKQVGDVFALEVFLVEDNGSVFEVGPLTVASTPATAALYPMDLTLLPLGQYPREECLRTTAAEIKKLESKGYPLSNPVKNLRAGLLTTADAVSAARQ
ncbi:hypothetical protein LG634_34670 [Streptomyces bambusae]|uniref:hypothetical protein n=1 Tax=Streptomyces bambusae TaxID=1550616 RepID=UPI001D000341|nr:hypothetical protein [Streptomyces bambusae]MCB5169933.1 hypothetical protein [Streptomyces bambusae]